MPLGSAPVSTVGCAKPRGWAGAHLCGQCAVLLGHGIDLYQRGCVGCPWFLGSDLKIFDVSAQSFWTDKGHQVCRNICSEGGTSPSETFLQIFSALVYFTPIFSTFAFII